MLTVSDHTPYSIRYTGTGFSLDQGRMFFHEIYCVNGHNITAVNFHHKCRIYTSVKLAKPLLIQIQINQPTMQQFYKFMTWRFMCRSTCFGRLHAHHQELTNVLNFKATRSIFLSITITDFTRNQNCNSRKTKFVIFVSR
jgi:hypothetical protein